MTWSINTEALRDAIRMGGVAFAQSSHSYIFDCPSCGKSRKLYVNKQTGRCICWVCGADKGLDGRCEKAMVALYGRDIGYWQAILRGTTEPLGRLELDFIDPWDSDGDDLLTPDVELMGWEWPPDAVRCDEAGGEKGMAYLESRGLAPDVVVAHDIRYVPRENRVCFPFVVGGELVGWQRRICGPDKVFDPTTGRSYRIPKALTEVQAGIAGNYVMFGDGLARAGHCVLTEGPISALKAHLCGGYVATLGKGMVQEAQIQWIAKRVARVYVGFDPDAAQAIEHVITRFATHGVETYLLMPPGDGAWAEDLGACTPAEVLEQFHAAKRQYGRNHMMLSFGSVLAR